MPLKHVYKITYPNGKIYVGMDTTEDILYLGSSSKRHRIAVDLVPYRNDFTIRKEIIWEDLEATDAEVRAMEVHLICELQSNNPEIGYNVRPRWKGETE